jgi:hypothetical protein
LVYEDVKSLKLEDYPEEILYDKMEQIFKQSLVPNARRIDLELCFIDGKIPNLFLPLIKLKNPKDLTVEELRVIWTNVSNCSNTYFSDFVIPFKNSRIF